MTDKHVCPPDHPHDTNTNCYHHHGCRCTPCHNKVNGYQLTVRKLRAYGRWQPYVDATPAREHLRVLAEHKIGIRRVAELTGIGRNHVRKIGLGQTTRIRTANDAKIRSIPADATALANGTTIPALGVQRRLQALAAVGWSSTALAPHLGMFCGNIARLLHQDTVTLRVHHIVVDAYEQLWNAAPTNSARSQEHRRELARSNGWVPPLAWDDIDTDPAPPVDEKDPSAVDEIAVALALGGQQVKLTRAERHVAVTTLNRDRGYDDQLISRMLGVSDKTIARDREHLGLPAAVGPDKQRIAA